MFLIKIGLNDLYIIGGFGMDKGTKKKSRKNIKLEHCYECNSLRPIEEMVQKKNMWNEDVWVCLSHDY